MKRDRLTKVRDTVRTLKSITDNRSSAQTSVTGADTLTSAPKELPRIDTLDMRVIHAERESCTVGSIVGLTIELYPETATRIADNAQHRRGHRQGPMEVADTILGFNGLAPHRLLSPPPHVNLHTITPEQAATAIDRVLAGEMPGRIWDHAR